MNFPVIFSTRNIKKGAQRKKYTFLKVGHIILMPGQYPLLWKLKICLQYALQYCFTILLQLWDTHLYIALSSVNLHLSRGTSISAYIKQVINPLSVCLLQFVQLADLIQVLWRISMRHKTWIHAAENGVVRQFLCSRGPRC